MEKLKTVFGDKALTYDEFMAKLSEDKSIKLADISEGQYVDRNKHDAKVNELNDAKNTIKQLEDQLSGIESDNEEIENLRNQIETYRQADEQRQANEQAQKTENALKSRFATLKGQNEYLNEGTENWIFGEFKKALELDENKGKSDNDIYEGVIKDKNIYVNPNQKMEIPGAGNGGTDKKEFRRFF